MQQIEINVPKLGVEMKSAVVDQWERSEGDWVNKGDILLSIQTDKVTYEIEAPDSGFLHIVGQVETEYQIGELLAQLAKTEEVYEKLTSNKNLNTTKINAVIEKTEEQLNRLKTNYLQHRKQRKKISPLAKKMAQVHSIDLAGVTGTGPSGAIVKRDILNKLEEIKEDQSGKHALQKQDNQQGPHLTNYIHLGTNKTIKETRPLSGIRKVIAERMFSSLQNTAQMTDINEVEVSPLIQFREELNELAEISGVKISYTALLVKSVASVLKAVPILNASIDEQEIILWENINIGFAVSIDDGLVVPVIHDADKLSIGQIQQQMNELIMKAKAKQIQPNDINGSTFTVTNIGSYGSLIGTPILNTPEVGILGTGAIQEKPVVKNGEIVIGNMMGTSLTVDHRLIDGAVAGRFQKEFRRMMENPKLLMIS
ncbi:dihydrolipoamide acetyltransferase family protein [Alkalihalobacterium alkalinitrilicum]|uniref:dihydrolipoamide acetyltransferase family protein n=1 Tax=Alkalihalobacterium alkalinitrilicum TaxID=427920 RepID=UPI000995859E|nr:dihydrolipoamide acetyltransferase family protein [Alkalihalobacterium alkalinitrilicum]